MSKKNPGNLSVISGVISEVQAEEAVENIFFAAGDREGMAATGVIAAALGLSGPAAGMAMMSNEEMNEPVMKLKFKIDGRPIHALLWNWPFKEGDEVKVVGSVDEDGVFFALSVVDEENRIIVSYPHVSAGSRAHWIAVAKYSLWFSVPFCAVGTGCFGLAIMGKGKELYILVNVLLSAFSLSVLFFCFIGYQLGRRFVRFTAMADSVFSSLGWLNPEMVNLRRISKARRREGDSPSLGDTYFRY